MTPRYSRQERFAGIGPAGQERLGRSRVVVVGCGALGSVSAEMLARAGVGHLVLVDRDFVEESNLARQSLFTEEDARRAEPKAVVAARALAALNSQISIEARVEDLNWENVARLCRRADVVLDGSDNFETRFLLNDFSVREGLPWSYGACVGSYGLAFLFRPGHTACLRCLLEELPQAGSSETCETAGVIAPVVHAVAAAQVGAVLRLLVGEAPPARLVQVDPWQGSWRTIEMGGAARPGCPCCAKRCFAFLEGKERSRATRLCGRNAIQVQPARPTRIDFERLAGRLAQGAQVETNDFLMRIRVEGYEIALFADGRSIVRGTEDPAQARALYARYVGH